MLECKCSSPGQRGLHVKPVAPCLLGCSFSCWRCTHIVCRAVFRSSIYWCGCRRSAYCPCYGWERASLCDFVGMVILTFGQTSGHKITMHELLSLAVIPLHYSLDAVALAYFQIATIQRAKLLWKPKVLRRLLREMMESGRVCPQEQNYTPRSASHCAAHSPRCTQD